MQRQSEDSIAVDVAEDSPPAPGMGRPPRPRLIDRLTWTLRQRRGMAVVITVVLCVLLWRAIGNRAYISDPQPIIPARFHDLADRFDPNTASWQELAAIPSLGERRARAIVEHREDWLKRHPGELPYNEPLDLAAVPGIGATMIEQMSPHLKFPIKLSMPE